MIINDYNSKLNRENGITLIALIVMMMVLVILAAVTVTALTGENSLLEKASAAGDKTNEGKAKEKLQLEISNLIQERAVFFRSATIDELVQRLSQDKSYQTRRQGSENLIVGTDGYAFRVDKNLKIVDTVDLSLLTTVEMEYLVKSTSGNTMNIKVIARSNKGLDKLITPDENEVEPDEDFAIKLETDYSVTIGQEYIFKVKLHKAKEIREFKLIPSTDNIPSITSIDSTAYPTFMEAGIFVTKNAQINYGTNTDNYYSTDDGQTWLKYEDKAIIDKECTLIAKSFSDEDIVTRIDAKDVKLNLAGDALGSNAYDSNFDTYYRCPGGGSRIVKVDEGAIGKKVYMKIKAYKSSGYTPYIYYKNKSGTTLKTDQFSTSGTNDYEYLQTVPNDTSYIQFYCQHWYSDYTSWINVYEFKLDDTPQIAQKESIYPIIKETGFEKYKEKITLKYDSTSLQRLYKIGDGEEWQKYDGQDIEVELGETLYAKGINSKNEESRTTLTYKVGLPGGIFALDTLMGYTSAPGGGSVTRRMNIDEGLQGRKINIKLNRSSASGYYTKIIYCSSNGTALKEDNITGSYGSNQYDYNQTIPENTAYINFYVNWWYSDYTAWMNVHSVSIVAQE